MIDKDGGPAFPTAAEYKEMRGNTAHVQFQGMSLRAYIACHAPPAPEKWMESGITIEEGGTIHETAEMHARWNVAYADALIAELAK